MKPFALVITCTIIAGCSSNSYAALLGSSRPIVQKNFQTLIKTNACPACNLAGVVLTRVNLAGANLEGANLAGAKLNLADFSGANLRNANLQNATLGGADLSKADLRGVNFNGAVLGGAYLKDALMDARVIDEHTFADEGLSHVTEEKIIHEELQAKHVPYTDDSIDDVQPSTEVPVYPPALIKQQEMIKDESPAQTEQPQPTDTPEPALQQPVEPETIIANSVEKAAEQSKTLTPLADMEEPPVPEPTAATVVTDKQDNAAPVAPVEETGFWGSVTSFFSDDSDPAEQEITVATEQDAQKPVVEPEIEPAPTDEIIVSQTQEVIVTDTKQTEIVTEEIHEDSDFWKSVGSIFTSDEEKTVPQPELAAPVEEEVPPPVEVVVIETEPVQAEPTEESSEKSGFWGSVTSVFSSEEEKATPQPEEPVAPVVEEVAPPVEVVIEETKQPEAVPAEENKEDSSFWGSITSVFSSEEEEATPQPEPVAPVVEKAAPPVQTDQQQGSELQDEIVVSQSVEEVFQDGEKVAEVNESEPAADTSVNEMIALIEESPAQEAIPAGAMATVETPAQAKAKQQVLIDRLEDKDRCVECDLAGVDLSGKNLSKVDLERANLQGANLMDVNLRQANLKGTDFSGANLTNADLREADLYLADFTDAILTGANFEEALIDSAYFIGATGVNLEGAVKEE